jgi:hypothetical protein
MPASPRVAAAVTLKHVRPALQARLAVPGRLATTRVDAAAHNASEAAKFMLREPARAPNTKVPVNLLRAER